MAISDRTSANRRTLLKGLGMAGLGMAGMPLASRPVFAASSVLLPLPGGPQERALTQAFPQKGEMILQRTNPPLLETPFEVFDTSIFTPNDRFYVRWHLALLPDTIDVESYRLAVRGQVTTPIDFSLPELMKLPRVEVNAVNQCSGNSRGLFQPRVAGGQWGNGAMGNARWTGVRLKDVLDKAGVKAGATAVRFKGLDRPGVDGGPDFFKSISVDHARDGEVMIAYAMNGQPLPLLNGFPLRIVVPGWYATYWIKMLSEIEVLDAPDQNFWMKTAYLIPDTPAANMKPGQTDVKFVPINRMAPRSFVTNLSNGASVQLSQQQLLRGIAFGGDNGVAKVDFSVDGGATWVPATLGKDEGKFSFRRFEAHFKAEKPGGMTIKVRCTNVKGEVQPNEANWNPAGFMRNLIETVSVNAV